MIKVLLVDDEVLALNYLKSMISWEENGYQVIGSVTNGNRALELYEKHKPDIVISDIRMVGMDGLELAMHLKEKNPDVIVILLSAYKDFEYAKKGIQYGVQNYLLKHELSEETLLRELQQTKKYLDQNLEKEKIYQKYFTNQLIYNRAESKKTEKINLGSRIFLIMVHRNSVFKNGNFHELELDIEGLQTVQEEIEKPLEDTVFYISDIKITTNNLIILYRIENTVSKYKVNTLIEQKTRQIAESLQNTREYGINVLYSYEISQREISSIFQNMSGHIRYSLFWKRGERYALSKLPDVGIEEKLVWSEWIGDLENAVYEENQDISELMTYIFEQITYPVYKLEAAKELFYLLENLLRKIEKKEGISRPDVKEEILKIEEIQQYYVSCYVYISQKLHDSESKKYSKLVLNLMRYIRKNYQRELNQELLGDIFQMNGVYLGQLFKKEVGVTCLKYLTNCRIEEAKRLLESGEYSIGEVTEKVGYKTSQYFSQIFVKAVGMKPQEYKNGTKKG